MTTKRIALVSAYFPPHMGGVERFTLNLAEHLSLRGNEVTVITSENGNSVGLQQEKYSVVRIPSISIMDDRFPLISPSPRSFRTVRSVLNAHFDLVIINTRYYPISLLGCHIAKRNGVAPVVIDHSSGFLSDGKSPLDLAMRHYEKAITKRIKKFSPRFFSVSLKSGEWLTKLGIEPEGILPNSIDSKEYTDSASSVDWRKRLGIADQNSLIVFAGRLIPEKGVLDAIEAFVELDKKDSHLVIAGNGPLNETIDKISTNYDSLHFVGALPPEDLSSLFRTADVFCYPSRYPEGLPTVLLEAASHKLGIITSNCAGANEVVPDSSYGIVLPNTNIGTIAKALNAMIGNPPYAKSCGQKCALRVAAEFSWEKTAQKIEELALSK